MNKAKNSKNDIHNKIGKNQWLAAEYSLIAKLDYIRGIKDFDEILNGKNFSQINAVVHIERYPKGLLLKIIKGIGGFKKHLFPLAYNDIKRTILSDMPEGNGQLVFELKDRNKIEFLIRKGGYTKVEDFFNEIGLIYETAKTLKAETNNKSENPKENTAKNLSTINLLLKLIVVLLVLVFLTLPFHYIPSQLKVFPKDHLAFSHTIITQNTINKLIARYNSASVIEQNAIQNEPLMRKLIEKGIIKERN